MKLVANDRDSSELLKKAAKKLRRGIRTEGGNYKSFAITTERSKHLKWRIEYDGNVSSFSTAGVTTSDSGARYAMKTQLRDMMREVRLDNTCPKVFQEMSFMMVNSVWNEDSRTISVPLEDIFSDDKQAQEAWLLDTCTNLLRKGKNPPYLASELYGELMRELDYVTQCTAGDEYYELTESYPEDDEDFSGELIWSEDSQYIFRVFLLRLVKGELLPGATLTDDERLKLLEIHMGQTVSLADFEVELAQFILSR